MSERDPGSFLLQIKPWLDSGAPFPAGGSGPGGTPPHTPSFSAADLRDRVAVSLLQQEIVETGQVAAAWRQQRGRQAPGALWRAVAQQPGVEAESVFAEAARVYAFAPASAILYRSRALLRSHRGRFSLRQRRRLVRLNVLPVTTETAAGRACWIFATHDPARRAVHALLSELDVPAYELRYAPAGRVWTQLEEAFPGEVVVETKTGAVAFQHATAGACRPSPPNATTGPSAQQRPEVPFGRVYERVLAAVARSGATRVRLAVTGSTAQGGSEQVSATFDYAEAPSRCVALATLPAAAFSFVRRRVRAARRSSPHAGGYIARRRVQGRPRRFRVQPLPEHRTWLAGRAAITIALLQ